MKTYQLNSWFQKNFPEMVKNMEECSHHYSTEFLNPFHLEGSVQTHNQMVMLIAEQIEATMLGSIAALLHDLGKPATRYENHEKKRVSMINHEAVSGFMAIQVMEKLSKDLSLSDQDKINIFFAICYHIDFHKVIHVCYQENNFNAFIERYKGQPNMARILVELGISDSLGRFSDPDISPKELTLITLLERMDKEEIFHKMDREETFDPTKPTFTMYIGLPGSGKSFEREHNSNGSTIICKDDFLTDFGKNDYRESFENNQAKANELLDKALKKAIKAKENIILDMTNLVKSRRISNMSQAKGYNKKAVLFLEDLAVIQERNLHRGSKFIPLEVYHKMMTSFSVPSFEDFDVIEVIYKGRKYTL